MKRFFYVFSAAVFAFVACNKETPEVVDEVSSKEVVLTFNSERPQLAEEVGTKTEWDAASSSIVWSSGDQIRVGYTLDGEWMGQSEAGEAKFYQSGAVVIDSQNKNKGSFSVPISATAFADPESEGEYMFYGVYPSSLISNATVPNAPSVNVTIPVSQTPGANTFDSRADMLIGKSAGLQLEGLPTEAINLKWTRVVAHGFLTFKDFKGTEEGETITKITLTAQEGANIVGGQKVNIEDGSFVAGTGSTNVTNVLTIQGTKLSFVNETVDGSSKVNLKVWICILPETLTALDVVVETNKAYYTRTITGFSREFKQNAKNNLPINMSEATRTPKSGQLVADGYYVISYANQMMTVGTESNSYRGVAEKNTSNPSVDAIWKINYVSASDAYTIHSLGANKDLFGTTTNDTNLSLAAGSNYTNLFTIEKTNSEATTYKIAPSGNSSRAIGCNTSTSPYRFALYTGSNTAQPITLDLTAITVDETPVITIAEDERTKDVKASATSVSFAYTANAFATTAPTVVVTSDADEIVNGTPTVGNGSINVSLNANSDAKDKTATLTVSGAGVTPSITLTINQAAKTGDVYTYTFTSKSWAATRESKAENWTSGKDGGQFQSGRGIQISTGANGTSPYTFTDVEEITVTYSTNASNGAGSIAVQVGNNTAKSITVSSTGGTSDRTLTYSYSSKESGNVKITVTCTTNSIYLKDISITAASLNIPEPHTITCATGLSHGSVAADKATARPGETVTLTATPETGYELDEWSVFKTGEETTKVTVTGNSIEMPDYDVTVSASFSEQSSGGTEKTSTLTFTAACGGSGTADDAAEWTVTSDGSESTFDSTKGIHYGTGSSAVQYIKLSTSDISGTITKVVVNASTASGVSATAGVTVNGADFGGAAQSLSTTASNYTFEGSASGEIIVTVTKPSSATGALYVKSIAVTYE